MAGKSSTQSAEGVLVVSVNKRARADYEITERLEAGLVLLGSEVKSIRAGGVNLKDSYIRPKAGELFLVGSHVSPYAMSRVDSHEAVRDRKLLVQRKELDRLAVSVQQKGLTLVPLRLYFRNGRCKLEFGVGKGKKHYDKREDVKAREAKRDIERVFSARNKRG